MHLGYDFKSNHPLVIDKVTWFLILLTVLVLHKHIFVVNLYLTNW